MALAQGSLSSATSSSLGAPQAELEQKQKTDDLMQSVRNLGHYPKESDVVEPEE